MFVDEGAESKRKKTDKVKVKEESKRKKIKKEKHDKTTKKGKLPDKEKTDEQNLMSVLELLELQARARAIRSQLALENKRKAELRAGAKTREENSDNEDAVIIESPKNIEIIITSSESENEESRNSSKRGDNQSAGNSKNTKSKRNSEQFGKEREAEIKSDKSDDKEKTLNNAKKDTNKSEDHSADKTQDVNSDKEEDFSDNVSTTIDQLKIASSGDNSLSKVLEKIDRKKNRIFRKRQLSNENDSKGGTEESEHNNKIVPETSQSRDEKYSKIHQKIEESSPESRFKNINIDENDGIVINVDQSEIECIISD